MHAHGLKVTIKRVAYSGSILCIVLYVAHRSFLAVPTSLLPDLELGKYYCPGGCASYERVLRNVTTSHKGQFNVSKLLESNDVENSEAHGPPMRVQYQPANRMGSYGDAAAGNVCARQPLREAQTQHGRLAEAAAVGPVALAAVGELRRGWQQRVAHRRRARGRHRQPRHGPPDQQQPHQGARGRRRGEVHHLAPQRLEDPLVRRAPELPLLALRPGHGHRDLRVGAVHAAGHREVPGSTATGVHLCGGQGPRVPRQQSRPRVHGEADSQALSPGAAGGARAAAQGQARLLDRPAGRRHELRALQAPEPLWVRPRRLAAPLFREQDAARVPRS
eukprot:CAMPEP_0177620214 /NCGR_PEP_ID=MMETSP0419_2-20121207/26753_1 /TAXON_ID=582737 /ORGANISM="Tetraselmis sp., Strain GSL018" /LENGTH=332 /DNA_ID=CAMNT_0019119691 /DNA_START=253 /DNA_END=1252 /DNA_ORIENTATION=+